VFERYAAPPANSLEWVQGDFAQAQQVSAALAGCEVVYHLISTTIPRSSNDDPVFDVQSNVIGTLRMLEQAAKAGVRKIVFVSSGGTVYGIPQEVPIKEEHPTQPVCSYGIGKLTIEKYLHMFRLLHGLDYCVLRLANPFGEGQSAAGAQGAVAVFLHRALSGQTIEIWGDGNIVRDYFYVSDAVRALLLAKDCSSEQRVFNIGSGKGMTLNQVADAIEDVVGHKIDRSYLPGRSFDVPVNVLDISRARQALGWRPKTTFEEGLRRTCSYIRQTQLKGAGRP
jgi:UDP-glucose 4-epimerase